MNKEKYEKILMDVVELKEDIIMTSYGNACGSYCVGDGIAPCDAPCDGGCDEGCKSFDMPANQTVTICMRDFGDLCFFDFGSSCTSGDMGTGCNSDSCSPDSGIAPYKP